MNNAERFLNAFVSIEQSLRDLCNTGNMKFYQMVNMVAKKNHIVQNSLSDLLEYAELRNAIIHQRGGRQEVIALPVDSVVKDIERIANALNKDQAIANYLHRKVVVCEPTMTIEKAFYLMQKLDSSKLPVYDEEGFVGMIDYKMIATWAMEYSDFEYVYEIVKEHQDKQRIVFVDPSQTVSKIINIFESQLRKGTYIQAVIVSKDGSKKGKPIGIYTSYDIPELIAYLK